MEESLDLNYLLEALDNEENGSLLKLDSGKIKDIKNNILQKLQLDREELKSFHKKLKNYRHVDELNDLKYGSYIRWINISNPERIKLTNGGIVCDIQVHENGAHIVCKNNMNYMFQLIMDECIIFQKITNEEQFILTVMDYLNKD